MTPFDPSEPITSPPPRTVEPWTRVAGHQVNSAHTRGKAFCSCGERQSSDDPPPEWQSKHLANAWPILMPRLDGESIVDWRNRIRVAIGEARIEAEPEYERLMAAMDVGDGQTVPVVTDFDFAAEERAEVLAHQLASRPFDCLDDGADRS